MSAPPEGNSYLYLLGVGEYKTLWGVMSFARRMRTYHYRVIRALSREAVQVQIFHPVSYGKILFLAAACLLFLSSVAG